MTSTTAVLFLMLGAAALAWAAMYFYVQNREQDLKKKLTLFNTILTQLQTEKSSLIVKSDNMFSEKEAQNVHLAHLHEENRILRGGIERLELDIDRLKKEYHKLAELLFKE